MRAALLLLATLLLGLVTLPPAQAAPSTDCLVWGTPPCTFHCNVGDTLRITTYANDVATTGTVECGGAAASCMAPVWGYCEASSPTPALFADEGECGFAPGAYGTWSNSYCRATPPSYGVEQDGVTTPPAGGQSFDYPAVGTPGVDPVSSPEVRVPATCTFTVCTAPTPVAPIGVPPIPKTCVPTGLLCVGPRDGIPVFPGADVPALCTLAPFACLPAGPVLLPAGTVTTPRVDPVTLVPAGTVTVPYVAPMATPGVGAYANASGLDPTATPNVGSTPTGPHPVDNPILPVTLCDTPCQVPYVYGNGVITVTLVVGDARVTHDVSV